MQAVNISVGHTIQGFGLIQKVNIFCSRVAVRKRVALPRAKQAMGMAGSALMAAEAERECYELVPTTVRAVNTDGQVRSFDADETVILVEHFKQAA